MWRKLQLARDLQVALGLPRLPESELRSLGKMARQRLQQSQSELLTVIFDDLASIIDRVVLKEVRSEATLRNSRSQQFLPRLKDSGCQNAQPVCFALNRSANTFRLHHRFSHD